jgi:DNA helicase-2/ATP-dependent DNA helicase PcrA
MELSQNNKLFRADGDSSLIDYEKALNPQQLEAVRMLTGPALVIAGAGSGKTRTLVYRVARLVEGGIPPQSILLLTFTCRASREMLQRASLLLSDTCQRVRGGTFHSLANQMLRKFSHHIGFSPSFTILDRSDSADAINLLRLSLGLDEKAKRFPKKDTIAEIFSKAANKSITIEQVLEEEFFHFMEHSESLKKIHFLYTEYKNSHQLMDYDDLLVKWKNLLEERPDIRDLVSRRFQYIMVDEYQDTNKLQAGIIRLMAATHDNVMVVGDDSQSIYSFRGANFKNIMDFPNHFPGTRIIKLEENYRSTQQILSLANSLIAHAREKYTKCLFTRRPGGVRARLAPVPDENAQSRFICERILSLRRSGVPLSGIAVLFRAGFHSFNLELELTKAGIPFVKYGGLKLMEAAHIKDVLAHLRVVVNPCDLLSWHRILLLINNIGHKTCQRIMDWLRDTGFSLSRLGEYPIGPRVEEGFTDLCKALEAIGTPGLKPQARLERLMAYYEPLLRRIYYDDYPKRLKDLEQLAVITNNYESLETLLTDMVLEAPEASAADVAMSDRDTERLTLSTIHSAKGLEWHTVFIISLAEGRFPSSYACESDEAIEEERRLMYVAVTRAKENLFLCYPVSTYTPKDGRIMARPSRFINDIPRSMFETREETGASFAPGGTPYTRAEQIPSQPGRDEDDGAGLKTKDEMLQVGARVHHTIFGTGRIREVLNGQKVVVHFDGAGLKTLHLGYTTLSVVR